MIEKGIERERERENTRKYTILRQNKYGVDKLRATLSKQQYIVKH